jgi:hypothetical protein
MAEITLGTLALNGKKNHPKPMGWFFQLFLSGGQEQNFEYLTTLENKNSKTFFKKPLDKIPLLC